MIKFERKIFWWAVIALVAMVIFLVVPDGWAAAAWIGGSSLAWFFAWHMIRDHDKKYRAAMMKHLDRYVMMLPSGVAIAEFIEECRVQVEAGASLNKMNRWFGFIQAKVIQMELTTVEMERDRTRGDFTALDLAA